MFLHIALIKSTAGNKTKLSPSPFLISTSWFLLLAEVFRNDLVAALVPVSAVPLRKTKWVATLPFRVYPKRHSVVAQRIGFYSSDVTRLVATEHIRNKYSLLKSRSVVTAVMKTANSLTLPILIQITVQVSSKKVDIYIIIK